jgi:hypothetical protein
MGFKATANQVLPCLVFLSRDLGRGIQVQGSCLQVQGAAQRDILIRKVLDVSRYRAPLYWINKVLVRHP